MKSRIGWGFLGAGTISKRFISGLNLVDDGFLAAVGSRTPGRAEAFTAKYGGKPYTTYEEMINDSRVDIVYIATPHSFHKEHSIMAMKAGKPVLCEKPIAPNARQTMDMIVESQKQGVYLMEAMWTRFFPVMEKVREWLAGENIGQVHMVQADFGFTAVERAESNFFNPDAAGGSLLGVGVYLVSMASMAFKGGKPERVFAINHPAITGVDARTGCLLGYEGGGMAMLFTSYRTNTPQEAKIIGEKGYITIPDFWHPKKAILTCNGKIKEEFFCDYPAEGYQYEIKAVHDDLRADRKENSLMTHNESLAIAETLDAVRGQIGLVYPFDNIE